MLFLLVCVAGAESQNLQDESFDRLNSIDLAGDEDEEASGDEREDVEAHKSKRFDWAHHPGDHNIYSGRSLMLAEDVKFKSSPREEEPEELDEKQPKNYLDDEDEPNPFETSDFVEKEWQLMFRSFDLSAENSLSSIFQLVGKHTNLFDEVVSRLEPNCRRDIDHIRRSAKHHRLWALRMLDSYGKLPSGITYGRFSAPGDYEECLGVQVDEEVFYKDNDDKVSPPQRFKFHGKYCLLDFRLPLPERPLNRILGKHDPVLNLSATEFGRRFPGLAGDFSSYANVFYEVGYLHAFCLPSSCDVKQVAKSMSKALEGMYLIVNNTIDCEERPPEAKPLRLSQVISFLLLGALFLNAACASFAHYMLPKGGGGDTEDKQVGAASCGLKRWLQEKSAANSFYANCFSVQTNFGRLTKPDPRGLTFVHYTRIVAMALTVLMHTAALGTLQAVTKLADGTKTEQMFRDLLPQMLFNAYSSIEIFFFMAGLLLVISSYPSIRRDNGKLSFVEYATKRAIRLMPGIAATLCVNFLWPLYVDGPMLSYFDRLIVQPCEENWWRTLGFISNYDDGEKMCLRHSYFSSSDYQLHIMAYPLLLLLYKQPTLSLVLAGLLTLSGFVGLFIMILTKNFLPFLMIDYVTKEAILNAAHYLHHPVWSHMPAFFGGYIIGYLVVRQIRFNLSPRTIKWLWYLLIPAGIVSLFAPYFWNHYKRPITKWQMLMYIFLDRFTLLTSCAWLSYGSMVLARSPKRKPPVPGFKQANLKVGTGTLANDKQQLEDPVKTAAKLNSDNQDSVQRTEIGAGIQRQRDSPDIRRPHLLIQPGSLLNRTKSASCSNLAAANVPPTIEEVQENSVQGCVQPTNGKEQYSKTTKNIQNNDGKNEPNCASTTKRPAVSNVNTLCLVLSRLTFQLFLFNMVVLWIDVIHSKYFWFFSYYFVIVKGSAVYIASSLMAMVFFITLESPSLTLYIAWVKGRAKRQQQDKTSASQKTSLSFDPPLAHVNNKSSSDMPSVIVDCVSQTDGAVPKLSSSPDSSRSGSQNSGKEGLFMRQNLQEKSAASLSYIDLAPTVTVSHELLDISKEYHATRM